MKVTVLKDFTRQGKKWRKGQIVEFTNDAALKLIKQKKVAETDKMTDDELKFEEISNKVYDND